MAFRFLGIGMVGLAAVSAGGTGAAQDRGVSSPRPAVETPADSALAAAIRVRIEAGRATGHLSARGHRLLARSALPEFYLRREFGPVWLRDGLVLPRAAELVEAIRDAPSDGLDAADYHLAAIESLVEELSGSAPAPDVPPQVDLELLLTDAFLVFGSHLLQGRVNPETVEPEWVANRRRADMAQVLAEALERGEIQGGLDRLRPPQPGYEALRVHLVRLRAVRAAGGWDPVPTGPTLRAGDSDERVVPIRRRLAASGDLPPSAVSQGSPQVFDDDLAEAVLRFQERHGLDPDGAVGQRTLEALNVGVEERIRQIVINLERWRWLPQELGARHVRVNIASFTTEVWERGETALTLRSIVGRHYRQTPVFSGSMTYLVLAPYWHVPPTIAAVDKLPLIKADPGYIAAQRMTLLDAATNQPVDPLSIDWAGVTGAELNRRFRLRQDPGPLNALGNVKFMFPNPYNVYLHDTPSRELFTQAQRDFSSGCVRVESPLELARYLLSNDPEWTEVRIREVVAQGRERTVHLPSPVPVHLLYWTAFADDDRRIHFRADVYQRDPRVWTALQSDPPGP